MLHHYNYTSAAVNGLPHLLSAAYNQHQLDLEQSSGGESPSNPTATASTTTTFTNSIIINNSGGGSSIIREHHEAILKGSTAAAAANKSFTIAAILGLNADGGVADLSDSPQKSVSTADLSVVNLSLQQAAAASSLLSNCGRLQLPVRHATSGDAAVEHYTAGRTGVRGLKHLASSVMSGKKNCKSKRVRTIFTPEQLERLEAEFERQQYMVGPERLYLAHTLQLTEAQVKVWFQNRRIKWRKHHLELTHQRLAVLKQQQQLLLEESLPDNQDTNSSSTDT